MIEALLLKKAKITQIDPPPRTPKPITVLFNPNEYAIERAVNYAEYPVLGLDSPILQFINGTAETLRMNLFFDTFTAGLGTGSLTDSVTFAATSLLPEIGKLDVRDYTKKIYKLMEVAGDRHAPPLVKFEWGSLSFKGYVVSVSQQFLKFNFLGTPVRARLDVTFKAYKTIKEQKTQSPLNSPDRTKFKVISEGDTLTAIAEKEYGDNEMWREIARANHIENPRLLKTGETIKIPAWL